MQTTDQTEMDYSSHASTRPQRECHKCPRNGKGDDYCWKTCLGPADDSRKGQNKVYLGSMEKPNEFIERNAAVAVGRRGPADGGVVEGIGYESERYLVQVLASMMSLSDIQLCIFRHIYLGEKMECVGDTLPVVMSKQAVSKHVKALREKHPVFDRMLSKMIAGTQRNTASRTVRNPRGESEQTVPTVRGATVIAQLDLFSGVAIGGIYKRRNRAGSRRDLNHVAHAHEGHSTTPTPILSI